LLQWPNLDELTESEWQELKRLDLRESEIKSKLPPRFNTVDSITSSLPVVINENTQETFIEKHRKEGKLREYTDNDGVTHILSVYYISIPADYEAMTEDVLVDEFSIESSEYMDNTGFDPKNSSYEQPRAYEYDFGTRKVNKNKKLYKNDAYDEIVKNPKLLELYQEFLKIMNEANQMFGYAAISSNYKLP